MCRFFHVLECNSRGQTSSSFGGWKHLHYIQRGKFFAKLDFAEAYLQIEIEHKSGELFFVNTYRRFFQFTRLPFGGKTAPAILQHAINNMISGLLGTAAYLDNIIANGKSENELQDRNNQLLSRIQEYGFHLRAEKMPIFIWNQFSIFYSFSIRSAVAQIRRKRAQSLTCRIQLTYQTFAHFWMWSVISAHFCFLCMRSAACKHAFKAMHCIELLLTHCEPKCHLSSRQTYQTAMFVRLFCIFFRSALKRL